MPKIQPITETAPLPPGPFSIILADCPWWYSNSMGCDPALAGLQYPVMRTPDICRIPVGDICAERAALFLWCTSPKAAEGHHLRVAEAWGFELVTKAFCFVKTNRRVDASKPLLATQAKGGDLRSGNGFWVNGNTEDCWLGFRKGVRRLARQSKNVKQLVFGPVTEHSAKPFIYDRIEALFGDLPRIELFARKPKDGEFPDDGWVRWGAEKDARL